jgi:TRAP-type C4-dicarboxylate transport system substrate-binding protein
MKLTKIAFGITMVAVVFLVAGSAMALELKLGHYAPESHPAHQAALMMAKGIEERTKGEVKIKIYPANQLGDGNEVLEQQMNGVVDLSLPTQPMLDKYGPNTPGAFLTDRSPNGLRRSLTRWASCTSPTGNGVSAT